MEISSNFSGLSTLELYHKNNQKNQQKQEVFFYLLTTSMKKLWSNFGIHINDSERGQTRHSIVLVLNLTSVQYTL